MLAGQCQFTACGNISTHGGVAGEREHYTVEMICHLPTVGFLRDCWSRAGPASLNRVVTNLVQHGPRRSNAPKMIPIVSDQSNGDRDCCGNGLSGALTDAARPPVHPRL